MCLAKISLTLPKEIYKSILCNQAHFENMITLHPSLSPPMYVLGGQNAEWILGDFAEGFSLVNLANRDTATFTGATATTRSSSLGASTASIIDI